MALVRRLLANFSDGAVKLFVAHELLRLRRERPKLFPAGSYEPLEGGEHVVGFLRECDEGAVACVVPRFSWKLTRGKHAWPMGQAWGDRSVPLRAGARNWTNVFTAERHSWNGGAPLAHVFRSFPVAILLAD